jgi:ribonuclease VapC
MFLDASALCAMITDEEDAKFLAQKLEMSNVRRTSPLAVWESVINVSRILLLEHDVARKLVDDFLAEMTISVIAIEAEMTPLALDARRDFGKGRHPAALNFGDCFAYACAKHHKLPLLFKGNDFALTDIESA